MSVLSGLIGYPTEHSLSPAIHEYWMRQHHIDGTYKLFTTPSSRLRQTVLHLRQKNMIGFNVTVPHKETVIPYLDGLDASAQTVGAVNTVTIKGAVLTGHNTDGYGFIENLRASLHGLPDLSQTVVLGAGGAARAAIVALKRAGAQRIVIVNRTLETAQKLAGEFGAEACSWDMTGACLSNATLMVNTTSLGMKHQPPLNMALQHLPESAVVYDIVYSPLVTGLLKAADARGNKTVDGLGMLLYQARQAFELWHGILPEVDEGLRNHVMGVMKSRGDA